MGNTAKVFNSNCLCNHMRQHIKCKNFPENLKYQTVAKYVNK